MIYQTLKVIVAQAAGVKPGEVKLEHPEVEEHGDYSTNIAMAIFSKRKNITGNPKGEGDISPRQLAEEITRKLNNESAFVKDFGEAKVAGAGFVNIYLKREVLLKSLDETDGKSELLNGKKIMVEYAHPNTHKEMHIGHMRTLITGEALARVLEAAGAKVFRANYQGDIGPHVAKAIWGTEKILNERSTSWQEADKLSLVEKAHLLGQGYVRGSGDYDLHKEEIDSLNSRLYQKNSDIWDIYSMTRQWSLDYYKSFYERFGTKFDRLYFESEVADGGKKIVLENLGKVFEESEGAVIFPGEKYDLHTRVFVTREGNPTYEAKDMALAPAQYADFPFDTCVHVVANEQTGYFQVVIKALELIDPKFCGREYHLPMGMVNLVGRKISSRTGDVVTVDGLLDEVKGLLPVKGEEKMMEAVTLAAVKYSVLHINPEQNVAFDIKQSVSLEGNSGPYLQYTYARTQSVLAKSERAGEFKSESEYQPNFEELAILRWIYRFPEVVEEAATRYAPNLVCNFLYELAQRFNTFYNKHSILNLGNITPLDPPLNLRGGNPKGEGDIFSGSRQMRLLITKAVGQVLKNGLNLLGIEVLERM